MLCIYSLWLKSWGCRMFCKTVAKTQSCCHNSKALFSLRCLIWFSSSCFPSCCNFCILDGLSWEWNFLGWNDVEKCTFFFFPPVAVNHPLGTLRPYSAAPTPGAAAVQDSEEGMGPTCRSCGLCQVLLVSARVMELWQSSALLHPAPLLVFQPVYFKLAWNISVLYHGG